ncbi:MAG: hypothetical protein ACXV8L_07920 [Ilumatobacteraceae bacterium]
MKQLARLVRLVAIALPVACAVGAASRAGAQPETTGPSVSLDRSRATTGDRVNVTISGFTASIVTVAVCGNEARLGSSDCNMISSSTVQMNVSPKQTVFPLALPPGTCPCVIRVSSTMNDEVAVAPIILSDVPIGQVVGGPNLSQPLVAVTIEAHATPHGSIGMIGAGLGDSLPYEVTVKVRNLTTEPLSHLSVYAALRHNEDEELTTLPFGKPDVLGPGQTWTQVVPARVPAPSFRRFHWQAVVSGAGPTVTAEVSTRHRPVLLLLVLVVLVADVGFIVIRKRMRRRAAREKAVTRHARPELPPSFA